MTRIQRIILWAAAIIALQVLIALTVAIILIQTDWFKTVVRQKIVTAVEQSTGGKVETGKFHFAWTRFRAEIRNFVIHGLEPRGAEPLFRADLVQVDLRLLSPVRGFVDIAALLVERPRVNLIVFDNGRTNLPTPRVEAKSGKTALAVIVDLAIGRLNVRNGTLTISERRRPLNIQAENLRAQLAYSRLRRQYTGEIDMNPLVVNGVRATAKMPVTLESDRIALKEAQFTTAKSKITVTGAMENLRAPRYDARINARLSVDEINEAARWGVKLDTANGPGVLIADVSGSIDSKGGVQLRSAQVRLGKSTLEASGTARQVQVKTSLALAELGRLFRAPAQPEGTLQFTGAGDYITGTNYHLRGKLEARDVGFRKEGTRISGITVDSGVDAGPHRIDLAGLRVSALGGSFSGDATLEDMDRYRVSGNVSRLDVDTILRTLSQQRLGYDGIISGPVQVQGSLRSSAAIVARAALAVSPGPRGIPVSGRLNVEYDGHNDTVTIGKSYLALPHTRIDLSGALGRQIDVRMVSRDLADFRPIAPRLPLRIESGGAATVTAAINGKVSAPHIAGQVLLTNFSAEGHPFSRLSGNVDLSKSGVSVSDGLLARGALEAHFSGSLGLRNWRTDRGQPVRADVTVRNTGVQDVLALAGQSTLVPVTGMLSADAHIEGTLGNPVGTGDVSIVNGSVQGEPFDSATLRVAMSPGVVDVPTFAVVAGASRLEGNAVYSHAVDDWANGDWRAHIASNQVQLGQFSFLTKNLPSLRGVVTFNADLAGRGLQFPDALQTLNANLSARGVEMDGKRLGDLTATAQAAGQRIRYNVTSNFAGSMVRVNGESLLTGSHDTTGTVAIANLPVDRLLALIGRRDIPVTGRLDANAQISGTLDDPRVAASASLSGGKIYGEPVTKVQGSMQYAKHAVSVSSLRAELAGGSIEGRGSLTGNRLEFHVRSSRIELANVRTFQSASPGVTGSVDVAADGVGTLTAAGTPVFSSLNASVNARGVAVDRTPLGDASLTATTQGSQIVFALASNLAGSDIRGTGRMQLAAGYPLDARVTFTNVTYSGLRPLLKRTERNLEATANGEFTVSGPAARPEEMRGTLQLTALEAHSISPKPNPRTTLSLRNEGPLVAVLDRGVLTVQNGRITGPYVTFNVTGTAALASPRNLNLRADASVNLESLEAAWPSIFSSGKAALGVAITGNLLKPVINGRLTLQDASLHHIDLPNGISDANGTIAFNGTEALIQNVTGETGGGKVVLSGFVAYGGPEMQFRIQANVDGARISAPTNVSTEVDARLTLAGTSSRSLLSGTVTIKDIVLYSHSDVGSLLTSAARPKSTPSVSTGLLAGIRYDVKIQTAPEVQVRTSLTQNLEIEANLNLRGGADHPGMLGRATVTQGEVVFFGSTYTIDQGTVSFYNPNKIDPILNIDLSTTVQGIDVSLSVSGPVDRMKFSYRSEPPLQFNEIVSLLAAGSAPTTDPVLAAQQPLTSDYGFPQAGASALVGQALASPVSGRLQRLFGVTRVRIDPQVTGAYYNTPTAALVLQQQITRNLTFSYAQDVSETNLTNERVEWSISPQWSAVLERYSNGQIDINVFFKKRF